MKVEKVRVSLSFLRASDHKLEETCRAVITNLYESASFESPPVTLADLQQSLDAFMEALAAQAQGGTAATAAKIARRRELSQLMETLALYVQVESDNHLETLLSSGFHAVRQNRARTQLEKPVFTRILNGVSGQALVTVKPVKNARCYELNIAALDDAGSPGAWQTGGLHTSSRNMSVPNLVPGKLYLYQARAIGGSTGYSDWSDATSHRVL